MEKQSLKCPINCCESKVDTIENLAIHLANFHNLSQRGQLLGILISSKGEIKESQLPSSLRGTIRLKLLKQGLIQEIGKRPKRLKITQEGWEEFESLTSEVRCK